MHARIHRLSLACALALLGLTSGPRSAVVAAPLEPSPRAIRGSSTDRLFLLVDFPYQLWSQGGTRIHLVAFGPDFRPAVGAEVSLAGQPRGRTDRNGTLVFRFQSPKGWKGSDLVVRLRRGGRILEGRQTVEAYRRTSSYELERVYLYTDRGIYRPGERLRARLVAFRMRDRYEPLAGRKAVLILRSPWGEVQRQELHLDAFGVGHAEVDLRELEPVMHTLRVQVGRASHSRQVKLALFKRPVLEIRHGLPSWFTARTPHLAARLTLVDLDGKSPRRVRLEITVKAGGKRLLGRELPIDGRAGYPLLFARSEVARFAGALKVGGTLQVGILATLADGTTAESEHELRLESQPYRAALELDRDDYAPGGAVNALVKLTDPDELPAAGVPVTLALPWGARLVARSNPQGTAAFVFKAPRASTHSLLAYVPEVTGPVARTTLVVEKPRPMESRLGVSQVVSRRLVPISVALVPGFTPLERVLHVDVTDHSGAIVHGFTVPWRQTQGRWEARGRFQAPSWGSMLLTMFSLAARTKDLRDRRGRPKPLGPEVAGVLMDGQQVTVHPDEALRLTVRGVPKMARPGAPLGLDLQVVGPDGKPRDALVGGALVDANVLALGDPLAEISPVPYFYNAELRTLGSTGSKMLTWPVLARTWSCERYDIALPPFGFAKGGPEDCAVGYLTTSGFGSGGGGSLGMGGAPERFTLRQRFDPTSWWAPALLARGGRLNTSLTLPDQISRQVLLLVASDREGGVGVFRQVLRVAQPLSLELDLPEQLTVGEELEVVGLARNSTGAPLDLALATSAEGLVLVTAPSRLIAQPGPPTAFRLRLRATRTGPASLELRASGRVQDGLRRTLLVVPAGEPRRESREAVAKRGAPAFITLDRPPTDTVVQASLRVEYPHVLPALRSTFSALLHPSLGGDTSVALLQTVALVHREGRALGLPEELRGRLRAWMSRSTPWLFDGQAMDGSYSYWRHGLPDAVHTAYVLETLLDLGETGVLLPNGSWEKAVSYLLKSRAKDGLWDVSSLAFWEGRGPDVRSGLSAGIFRALARASTLECPKGPDPRLLELAGLMARAVQGGSRDPRTVAAAMEGLQALYHRCEVSRPGIRKRLANGAVVYTPGYSKIVTPTPAQQATLETGARLLLTLRDRQHWEPTWFDAYGGQLEATAASLRVLHRLSPVRHATAIREAVAFLLARRNSWGEWHNERGTASVLRALLEVSGSAAREREGARIRILVNGKVVKEARLDPKDPWATAVALGQLRLTDLLRRGKNLVEVRYDGAFGLPVRLAVRRWPGPAKPRTSAPPRSPAPGAPRPAPRTPKPAIELPASLGHGKQVSAKIALPACSRGSQCGFAIEAPPHLALDQEGLLALRRSHPWLGLAVRGRTWTLTWPPRPPLPGVALPLRTTRRGRALLTWRPLPGTLAPWGSLAVVVD